MGKIKLYLLFVALFFNYTQGFWERILSFNPNVYRLVEFSIVLFILFPVRNFMYKAPGYRIFTLLLIVGYVVSIANMSGALNWFLYMRYFIYFYLIYHQFWNNSISEKDWNKIFRFLIILILLQGLGSFITTFILGQRVEAFAGLMFATGGTTATTFPLLITSVGVLIWLFAKKNKKLSIILLVAILGSFIVGFSSTKRAIFFLLPISVISVSIISFIYRGVWYSFHKKMTILFGITLLCIPVYILGIVNSHGLNKGLNKNESSIGVITNAIEYSIFYEGSETSDGESTGRSITSKKIIKKSLESTNEFLVGNGFRSLKQDERVKSNLGVVYGIVGFSRDIASGGWLVMLLTALVFVKILLTNKATYKSKFTSAFRIVIFLVFIVIHFGYSVDLTANLKISFFIAIFCSFLYSPNQSNASRAILNKYLY